MLAPSDRRARRGATSHHQFGGVLYRGGATEHAPYVMRRNQFRGLAAIAAIVAVALLAMPALGVDPWGSPPAGPSESSAPASVEPSTAASAAPSAAGGAPAPAPAASAEATEPHEAHQGDNPGKPH